MKHIDWFHPRKSKYNGNDYRSFLYTGRWQNKFIDEYVDIIKKDGIDEARLRLHSHKDEHFPESLFKFFSPSLQNLICLLDGNIWMRSPREYNDPFDGRLGIDSMDYIKRRIVWKLQRRYSECLATESTPDSISFSELYRLMAAVSNFEDVKWGSQRSDFLGVYYGILMSKSDYIQHILNSIYVEAQSNADEILSKLQVHEYFVSCFSNLEDDGILTNNTLWSHYSSDHRGFCVKYDLKFPDGMRGKLLKCGLFKVNYTSRVSNIPLSELSRMEDLNISDSYLRSKFLRQLLKSLTVKSKSWSYEREWRMILHKEEIEMLGENPVQMFKPVAVYLGCRIESNIKQFLVREAKERGIDVYEMRKSTRKFELEC